MRAYWRLRQTAFCLLSLASACLFVACTNAKLTVQPASTSQSVESASTFYLPAPELAPGPHRYIFFVDMSFSMVGGNCKTDVDNDQEPHPVKEFVVKQATNPGPPCVTKGAVDPTADRLAVITKWIQEVQSQPDTKVMVMPFSGGFMELRRLNQKVGGGIFGGGTIPEEHGFTSVDEGLAYVKQLQTEHATDLEAATSGSGANKFMGTSVPGPALLRMTSFVYSDMKALQAAHQLFAANYHLIFLSDGVPTPTMDHAKTALNLKQCSHSCLGEPSKSTCTPECRTDTQDIYDYWGNPDDNLTRNIQLKLRALLSLPDIFGEGHFQLSLVLVHPKNIESRYLKSDSNYLIQFRTSIPEARSVQLDGSTPPFDLIDSAADVVSYKLTHFYALNPFYRLNVFGKMEADSDGDGLPDSEELRLGFDPHKMRTDGVCLDSIAAVDAYRKRCETIVATGTCNPNLDADGDGLNECEEKILGTNPLDFDSDGDGIPDGLEVIYQNYLGRDDSQLDSNSDGINNIINFSMNLMPNHYPSQWGDAQKIRFKKQFTGVQVTRLPNGKTIQSDGYQISLENAPIGPTLGAELPKNPVFVKAAGGDMIIPPELQILGGNLLGTQNTIVFLARAVNLNDPTKAYWYILKKTVDIGPLGAIVNMPVDLTQMHPMLARDPIIPNPSGATP